MRNAGANGRCLNVLQRMGCAPGGGYSEGMACMESLCLEIRSALLERRQRLAEEIGRHPRPITACDVHFNRLLEERAAVSAALDRFDEFVTALRG